mmetsp:Transcript_37967/g.121838  ORF Transcript_37967/g.121838 Transcript_37967/m.121838 type:complete len:229 (+) Transcript_37967:830-1516(+)
MFPAMGPCCCCACPGCCCCCSWFGKEEAVDAAADTPPAPPPTQARLPPARSWVWGALGGACSSFLSRGLATMFGANLLMEFRAPATRSFCFFRESRCFRTSSSWFSNSSMAFGSSDWATDKRRFSRSSATTARMFVSNKAQTFSVMRFAATPQYAMSTVRMSSTIDMDVTPWFAMYHRPRLVNTRSLSGCSFNSAALRRRSSSSRLTTTWLCVCCCPPDGRRCCCCCC